MDSLIGSLFKEKIGFDSDLNSKSREIIQGIIALKRLDVKISRGNVIPSLNGSQLHSSHRR